MWAAQADAIVVAHITKLSPVDGPTMWPTPEGEWEEVHDCVFANPALSIGLQVDRTLSGTLHGDVTVMIGRNQVQRFNPLPVSGDSGSVEWIPTHLSNRGPLWVGQRIMLGLHRIEQGWSLMGDTILGIDSQGTVFAPERTADCLSTDPIDVHGLSIDAVAELMACSLDPVAVEERRAARESTFGDAVSTYATLCGSRGDDPIDDNEHSGGDGEEVFDPNALVPLPHPADPGQGYEGEGCEAAGPEAPNSGDDGENFGSDSPPDTEQHSGGDGWEVFDPDMPTPLPHP